MTSRKRIRKSDDIYNARRRYARQAERYMKQSMQESGVLQDRYRQLAKESAENALRTYEKPQSARVMQGRLKEVIEYTGAKAPEKETTPEQMKKLEMQSYESLQSAFDDENKRRDQEAKVILGSLTPETTNNFGNRIYGAFAQKFKDEPDLDTAIMEHFGVDSMMDVIEIIESKVNIYADIESQERYDEVRSLIELEFAA